MAIDLLTALIVLAAAMAIAVLLTHVYDLIQFDHRRKR